MFYVLNLIAAMHERIQRIEDKDRGATATEYAMLVALIAIIISVGVGVFGNALNGFFNDLAKNIGIVKG
jgi:pilus assembly protein Flp/PilA